MGGTGASTGLMPAFTLGCGTWGGSATSENVTPMHLINIKRVAYGLKDCTTLASDDPTFNHPELTSGCTNAHCTEAAKEEGLNQEDLMSLVNQLVSAMKGAN